MNATKSNVRIPSGNGGTLNRAAVIVRQVEAGYEVTLDELSPHNQSWMTAEAAVIGRGTTVTAAKDDFVRKVVQVLAG